MLIYLAASYLRHPEMRTCRDQLEAMGHKVTSRWIEGEEIEADDGTIGAMNTVSPRSLERFAKSDIEDIEKATCMISFTDGAAARGGRHAEFGYALALGLAMIVVGPREHIFHYLPEVEHFETWDMALVMLHRSRAKSLMEAVS
jgi:nucleoside 2-deoxyribosyltransferase